VELDIHCQPEVAEEMQCCLNIGGWLVVGHRRGKNNDHMGGSLEDNGICGPQLVVERQGLAAESQLLSFA
jgi:hypothetical protein